MMRSPHKISRPASLYLFPTLLLLLLSILSSLVSATDYFCGTTWPDAAESCHGRCSMGDDSDCIEQLGVGYQCFSFTGCNAKIARGEVADPDGPSDTAQNNNVQSTAVVDNTSISSSGSNNNFCGTAWTNAMKFCNRPCPLGTECRGGLTCYAATNCDKPLQKLRADMLVTLTGAETTMEAADGDILGGTIGDLIRGTLEEEGVAMDGVDLGEQSIVGRRELQQRYNGRRGLKGWHENNENEKWGNTIMKVANVTQRKLVSGSSALDVSMVITGDYRPPPYLDLNVIAEDSINRQGEQVIKTLRDRGDRVGRSYFNRVDGIEAVARDALTPRPTNEPTRWPTVSPTIPPSYLPSLAPSYGPTALPSSSPSRSHDQIILTGNQDDLQLGGTTTSSYGYIFNIRTKQNGGVVLINGFDFYTESTDIVNYELWSRQGSFKDYKGSYEGWDLIATGSIKGRGIGRYTSLPEEAFTPVHIPGGGGEDGTRAFYLTLESKELVYKIGGGSTSDAEVQFETEDLEVWEGESVLSYPFPSVEDFFYYRYPRQYLGAIRYDRLPCKPYNVYGQVLALPCPLVPTGSPTIPPPTRTPVTNPPSGTPTVSPVRIPTEAPTITAPPAGTPTISPTIPVPTAKPTTGEPTGSPIIPMRVNIVSVIRNVPDRDMNAREVGRFLEIMQLFLTRHTQESMTIDGIDFWHHKLMLADADEATTGPQVSKKTRSGSRRLMKNKNKVVTPQVPAVEITMILRISTALLPFEYLGNLAALSIDDNQSELLTLLNEQSAFYTYFKDVDGIQSRTILEVTNVPTGAPTTVSHFLAMQDMLTNVDDGQGDDTSGGGAPFMLFVGLAIGALWCCLTIFSISYLMKRRARMQDEHDVMDLLRQEKAATAMENEGTPEEAAEDGEGAMKPNKSIDHMDEEDPSDDVKDDFNENSKTVKPLDGEDSSQHPRPKHSLQSSESFGVKSNGSKGSRQRRRRNPSASRGSLSMSGLKTSLKGSFTSSMRSSSSSAQRTPQRRQDRGFAQSVRVSSSRDAQDDVIRGGQTGRPSSRQMRPNAMVKSMVVSSGANRGRRAPTRQVTR